MFPQGRDDVYTILDYKWYQYFLDRDIYLSPKRDRNNGIYWCYCKGKHKTIRVHSIICCKGCDHINGNKSDNRECNLRPATNQQNSRNRGPTRINKTGYKGVQKVDDMFCVQIRIKDKLLYFGCFENVEEAARVYDKAALKYFGEFAWTNFDKDTYTREDIESVMPKENERRGVRRDNKLGLKGVSQRGCRYVAKIRVEKNRYKTIGTYATAEEAARAYDEKALATFGNKCFTNFPKEDYGV